MLGYLCFIVLFWNANSASAPFITPCKDGDNACTLRSAQAAIPFVAAGIPEWGVKPLDPLRVPLIESDQGELKLAFKDTVLTGLKGCKIDNIKHDRVKGKQTLVFRCSMVLEGDYVLNGQLFILPVKGNGKYRITIDDIVIKTVTDFTTEVGADGEPHWKIGKWRHSYVVNGGATFQFDNLFNGNKALADPIIQFANTNWKDMMQEVAPPIVKAIITNCFESIISFYGHVSANSLYLA